MKLKEGKEYFVIIKDLNTKLVPKEAFFLIATKVGDFVVVENQLGKGMASEEDINNHFEVMGEV